MHDCVHSRYHDEIVVADTSFEMSSLVVVVRRFDYIAFYASIVLFFIIPCYCGFVPYLHLLSS